LTSREKPLLLSTSTVSASPAPLTVPKIRPVVDWAWAALMATVKASAKALLRISRFMLFLFPKLGRHAERCVVSPLRTTLDDTVQSLCAAGQWPLLMSSCSDMRHGC